MGVGAAGEAEGRGPTTIAVLEDGEDEVVEDWESRGGQWRGG